MPSKHIGIFCDGHSGHGAGFTPPNWQWDPRKGDRWQRNCAKLQREGYDFIISAVRSLPRLDIGMYVGDMLEGDDEKEGGVELMTRDRSRQCTIAEDGLKKINAREWEFVEGTPYHGGKYESWEKQVADRLGAEIRTHAWPQINGLVFDMKHYLPGSKKPELRPGKLIAEKLQAEHWVKNGRQPRSDIMLRAHNHYYVAVGMRDWLGLSLPALSPAATRYGALRCSGEIDMGFVYIEVFSNGGYRWRTYLARLQSERALITKLS
jgi:hypothetical protein